MTEVPVIHLNWHLLWSILLTPRFKKMTKHRVRFSIMLLWASLFFQFAAAQQPPVSDKIMLRAEQMPCWLGCASAEDSDECTVDRFREFIKEKINYPEAARAEGISGDVIVSFVVNAKGEIKKANLMHDIGGGCGEEALRLVNEMPAWTPGEHKGQKVNVIYSLEVSFIGDGPQVPIVETGGGQEKVPEEETITKEKLVDNPMENEQKIESIFRETSDGRIYSRVNRMPYFKGCGDLEPGTVAKRECSNEHLVEYIANNINYPESAVAEKLEGVVLMKFVIDESGKVVRPKVIRGIGGACEEEAIRVVSAMPAWTPGEENGEPVSVEMLLPVRFNLESAGNLGHYRLYWANLRGKNISEKALEQAILEKPIIRDRYGNEVEIANLQVNYQKGGKVKSLESSGKVTEEMKKMLRKAKNGSSVTLVAMVRKEGEMFDIPRTFEVTR